MKLSVEIKIKDATRRALKEAAKTVRQNMIELAKTNLSPRTAQIYIKSLTNVKMTSNSAEFMLKGWLSNAIEKGCNPFDMKIGLLSSPKVKISKKGNPYLRIPIGSNPVKVLTVSSVSKPGSWIHPGFIARDFWGKATYIWRMKK